MLKMTGIDHVVLHPRDLARAKTFYLDLLGMTVDHESSWQCFMHCGSQGVAIFEQQEGEAFVPGHDLNHMALVVHEGTYESIKTELEHHGVKVEGRAGDPNCIYFHDPDGHRLQILYPK
jgi:catechol-2,3-dioxygenase